MQDVFESDPGYHIFNTVRNTYVPMIERIVDEMRAYGIDIITANCGRSQRARRGK